MSNIDQVIQRARQPGGFSEQQQFTVARERGIHKMREFALADPHYYILELIQATVANGGNHVHIEVDDTTLQFSYVGGGYAREELAQLFDFLFASKEDLAHADIRQLALGVNALMIMEPSRIIIESGDGTMQSTDRIEIRGDQNTVEVGTPDQGLRGTFLRVEGLDRSKISGKSGLSARDYGPPECTAIEQRCLAAPVPIIINSEPVFGYSSQRTPVVFGYDDVVRFDEGDFYGSIGVPNHRHKESFKLMTFGVWIESTDAALMDTAKIGGVICYDRLNKTADHSGIVRDERFEEMWARMRPYARQAAEGRAGRGDYSVRRLSGEEIPSSELRDFFRSGETFVVVPESTDSGGEDGDLAASIGNALDAPVLCVDEDALDSVKVLAGADSALLEPNLSAPAELEFYRRSPAEEPDRPWLTGAVEIDEIGVEELGEALVAEESVTDEEKSTLVEQLGTRVPVRGTVYTPEETGDARDLYVRLITVDRVVWEGSVQSPFPGHILDIELPAVAPSHLLGDIRDSGEGDGPSNAPGDEPPLAALIARVVAARAVDKLQSATRRALENLSMREGEGLSETGQRIGLAALGRSALKRLRRTSDDDRRPDVHFSLVRPQPGQNLLELDVFEALDGTTYSLRDLEELMEETAGLVYGTVPEVDAALEGLDRTRIFDLDLERERQLLTIVGEAAYVRIDERDLIAESGPFRVRDMAIGLRRYPDFPILVEGGDPSTLEPNGREAAVQDLVNQLIEVYQGDYSDPSIRREAVRHLQWFVCHRTRQDPDAPTWGVEKLPLFLDGNANPVSFESVLQGLASDRGVEMIDGRSSDVTELGQVTHAEDAASGPVRQLTMNTWVFELLNPLGYIWGAFDFDFTESDASSVEATPEEAFVEARTIDQNRLDGRIGVPVEPPDQPAVAVVDADRSHTYRMVRPAFDFGLTGFIHVAGGSVESRWDDLQSLVAKKGSEILGSLLDEITEIEPDDDRFRRRAEPLFDFAARQLQLTRTPNGAVVPHIEHPLAQKILELPLFATDTGNPVSALRLIREFCADQSAQKSVVRVRLADDVPQMLRDWLERHLTGRNIVEPAGTAEVETPETDPSASIAYRLEAWLGRLRPDDHPRQLAERRSTRGGPANLEEVSSSQEAEGTAVEKREWRLGGEDDGDSEADPELHTSVRAISWKNATEVGTGISFEEGTCCRYVNANPPTLYINADHPWVQKASDPSNGEAFAWLLLNSYAHINDLLEPVTNEHELEFQRRVADAIDEF